jgi:hypothetical protein
MRFQQAWLFSRRDPQPMSRVLMHFQQAWLENNALDMLANLV